MKLWVEWAKNVWDGGRSWHFFWSSPLFSGVGLNMLNHCWSTRYSADDVLFSLVLAWLSSRLAQLISRQVWHCCAEVSTYGSFMIISIYQVLSKPIDLSWYVSDLRKGSALHDIRNQKLLHRKVPTRSALHPADVLLMVSACFSYFMCSRYLSGGLIPPISTN